MKTEIRISWDSPEELNKKVIPLLKLLPRPNGKTRKASRDTGDKRVFWSERRRVESGGAYGDAFCRVN